MNSEGPLCAQKAPCCEFKGQQSLAAASCPIYLQPAPSWVLVPYPAGGVEAWSPEVPPLLYSHLHTTLHLRTHVASWEGAERESATFPGLWLHSGWSRDVLSQGDSSPCRTEALISPSPPVTHGTAR